MRIKISALCVAFIFATAALAQPGSLDLSFNPTTLALGDVQNSPLGGSEVESTVILPDDKILVGVSFILALGINPSSSWVFRLNKDGNFDETFNPSGQRLAGTGSTKTFKLLPNGKIIIAGDFFYETGTTLLLSVSVIRLDTSGSLDETFIIGQTQGGFERADVVALQADGKIIIAGSFNTYNGITRYGIARLNTDGSLDETFNTGAGFGIADYYRLPYSAAIQSDGKIIIGGSFASYNGSTINGIARLNTDGSLDETFNMGAAALDPPSAGVGWFGSVYKVEILPNGKIIIVGKFTSYNGIPRNSIARLNADGSLDETFNPGTGIGGPVNYISILNSAIQPNGKIIIGGQFTSFDGTPRNNLARLNPDGSLDETFNPGGGANSLIKTITLQTDGKIIIGGEFSSYDGVARNNIARINGDEIADGPLPVTLLNFTANKIKNTVLLQWQTAGEQNTSRFIIEKSTDGNSFEAIGNVAAKNTAGNHAYQFTDAAAWVGSAQYYRLKMMDTDGRFTYSNIVRVANNSTGTVAVYPNPASDIVVIQQSNNSKLLTKARLLDISGKTIQSISVTSYQQKVSLQHLSAGVYMIQFEDGSNVKVIKR